MGDAEWNTHERAKLSTRQVDQAGNTYKHERKYKNRPQVDLRQGSLGLIPGFHAGF